MDTHSKLQRSYNMSRIKSSNTKLEKEFRKYIWSRNLRGYRIKTKILGKPDLYFPKQRIAVFIDGCFWHKCPDHFISPKSRNKYWDKKIENNAKRDKNVTFELNNQEIKTLRFWEHELEDNIEKCYIILKTLYEKK